jgi:hypothetical protein
MKYLLATLVAVVAIEASPASAQLIVRPPAHASLRQIERSQKLNLAHARYICRHGRHYMKRWGCQAVSWLTRELHQTEAALHPAVSAVSHYDAWACITDGAYPGAPHEGNGYNGLYTGPLGMTNPWSGYSGDWVRMGRAAVYAIADRVAAAHGYNDAWMRGQWPQTYPPCADKFH